MVCGQAEPLQERSINESDLLSLISGCGLSTEGDLVEQTQEYWLRKPGLERWEIEPLDQELTAFVMEWAQQQKFFEAWTPAAGSYTKALILGGTTGAMEKRLSYLAALWRKGIRFREIVWLVGERPLDPRIEELSGQCANESEAARFIWRDALLPASMRALSASFVSVPMQLENGISRRPNTADTLYAWLALFPEPCSLLLISSQPFCLYQHAVVERCLPAGYLFDLVGPEYVCNPEDAKQAALILDTIARWLYSIK
jgi:hypothetical protein